MQWEEDNQRRWGARRRYPWLPAQVGACPSCDFSLWMLPGSLSHGSVSVSVWQEEKGGGMKMGQDIRR